MVLTQISSNGIKDGEIKNADMADDSVGVAELSATGTASSSTFLRGDNSWVTPTDTNTQLAFANDANNRVITGTGSGLNGEANLTFDGTHLTVGTSTSNASDTVTVHDPGNVFMSIRSDAQADGNNQVLDFAVGTGDRASSNLTASIAAEVPSGATAGGTLKGDLKFSTNAGNSITERLRIQSGGGISFNGDTAAANALDSYEEGVWTPTLMFGGTSTGVAYAGATGGSYVKIGRQVIVHGRLNISNKGSSTGNASIGGFPFAAANVTSGSSGIEGDAHFSLLHDIVSGQDHAHVMGTINEGNTQIDLRWNNDSGDNTSITNSNFENDTSVSFSCTYPAA